MRARRALKIVGAASGRGWRVRALIPALLLALIGAAALLTTETGTVSARRFLADPMAVFAARSPGAREAGALTQTKPARVHASARRRPFVPTERVLPMIRERPGATGDADGVGPLEVYPQPAQSPLGGIVPGGPNGPGLAPLGVGGTEPTNYLGGTNAGNGPTVPGNGGGSNPTTPGNGGGSNPPTTPGNGGTTPPGGGGIVPSIPEPATWLMMALGMAAIGLSLRQGRIAARLHGNAAPEPHTAPDSATRPK